MKLFDKMGEYEMDPVSIVEDAEWTWFCPQKNRRMNRRMDKVKPIYPRSTLFHGGYNEYVLLKFNQ